MDLFENAVFMLTCGRVKTELFENADVTASIYDVSEHAHGSLEFTRGQFACLLSLIVVRMSHIVIEYQISLSDSKFRMSHRLHVDGDIFENSPRVDADLFYTDKMGFKKDPDMCGRGLILKVFCILFWQF